VIVIVLLGQLKEKGKEMVVTEQNKREYVDLLASWRLKGVASMFASLFSNAYELHLYNCSLHYMLKCKILKLSQ
jgi:hypothetical protein